MRRLVKLLAKLLVSAVLVTLILKSTDAHGVGHRLLETNIRLVALFAGLMALLPLLSAMRWSLLVRLARGNMGTVDAYRLVMVGNFVGQVLPVIGADAMRVWYAHRLGVSLGRIINSVVLDRVVALGGMLLLVLFSLPWLWSMVPTWFFGWIASLMAAAMAVGLVLPVFVSSLPQSWQRRRLVQAGRQLMIASNDLLDHKPSLVYVLGLSLLIHLSIAVLVFGIARMAGVPVELGECVLLIPLVMLVAAIPVSVAGWGVREGAMVIAFGFINVSPGDALLVSVLFGLIVIISTLPGAVFWVTMGRPTEDARVQHGK